MLKKQPHCQELAENTIRLAQSIPDPALQEACVAAAIGFASKFFNEADLEKLKGVAKMSELIAMDLTALYGITNFLFAPKSCLKLKN